MKKIVLLLSMVIFNTTVSFAQTGIVHDPINNIPIISQWLTSIDELYANYDMIMNTITQIENQYKSIQQAIENAKGIDWENIQFDGDFDIRDDIKNANRRVNSLLSQANAIKDTLNTTIIQTDGASYSLADICGFGEDGKGFASCVKDVYGFMKDNIKSAVNAVVGNLTEEQEKAIWMKYGISPRNYYLVAQTSKLIRNSASSCIAKATDQAKELTRQENYAKQSAVVKAALETKTSDGTIPQGAMDEASLLTGQVLVDEMVMMRESIDDAGAAISQKLIADEQNKEIEASEKYAEEKSIEIQNNNVPAGFAAGRAKTKKK